MKLFCGVSSDQEITEIWKWTNTMYSMDQNKFGTQIISLDVEGVKTTFYNTLRMAQKLKIRSGNAVLKMVAETNIIHRYQKDCWKQAPGKIMIGNGITWACMIFLDLKRNWKG